MIEDVYPMSDIERGLIFHSISSKEKNTYHEQLTFQVKWENFTLELCEKTLALIVQKHQSLRVSYRVDVDDELLRLVHKEGNINITFDDISALNKEGQENHLNIFLQEERNRPFEIEQPSLWRFHVSSLGNSNYYIIFQFHHAILDGWSVASLMTELFQVYEKVINEPLYKPSPLTLDYKEYVIQELKAKNDKSVHQFWKNYLLDYKRLDIFSAETATESFAQAVPDELYTGLQDLSSNLHIPLQTLCFGAYLCCMDMLTYENDFLVGLVGHNRPVHPEGDKLLGCFVNTVPYRHFTLQNGTWENYLNQVHANILNIKSKWGLSLIELARYAENSQKQNPFFDTLFNYTDFHIADQVPSNYTNSNTEQIKLDVVGFEETNTFLDFIVGAGNNALYVTVHKRRGFVANWSLKDLYESYLSVLGKLVYHTQEKLTIPEKLFGKLFPEFEKPCEIIPAFKCKTIPEIFQEKAALFPQSTALAVWGGTSVSYEELDLLSNKLANYIRSRADIRANDRVGIELDRHKWLIAGIMAILKSGAAYVPIDPDYPVQRKNYIKQDSKCKLIIDEGFIGGFKLSGADIPAGPPHVEIKPSDLAYIIYTSGTTGNPKGVMVEHRNLVNLLYSQGNPFDFGTEDVWTLFHSPCFDFSVWEIFGSLLTGGRLVLFPGGLSKDPEAYHNILLQEKVTILNQTPSAFNNLSLAEEKKSLKELSVRCVIFGGEALKPKTLATWNKRYPSVKLINMFGITETTIHVTYKEIGRYEIENNISNIGNALPSHRALVLDKEMRPLPHGAAGELYVGGACVSQGYLGMEELTSDRFVSDPFSERRILYRSGDKVRLLENGEMEYLGRVDEQVQLRGFRIELGEIEANLMEHSTVSEAVSVLQKDGTGDMVLCAYIKTAGSADTESVREFLRNRVPAYMVPSYIMAMEEFPLTPNGKIDKKSLAKPFVEEQAVYIAPSTDEERAVTEAWSKALDVELVGMNDDFFALGGDSIKSIRVISKINKSLNIDLTIADIYQHPQARDLASFCKEKEKDAAIVLKKMDVAALIEEKKSSFLSSLPAEEQALIEDTYPMSDIERGMVFHSTANPDSSVYHIQHHYFFRDEKFDLELLRHAYSLLVEKHEALRVSYKTESESGMFRVVHKKGHENVIYDDISSLPKNEQEVYISRYLQEDLKVPFKLEECSLWRSGILNLGSRGYCITFQCHHAILDGWSVASLMTELYQVYSSLVESPSFKPEPISLDYKEYVINELVSKKDNALHEFWKSYLSDYNRLEIFNDISERHSLVKALPDQLFAGIKTLSKRLNIPYRTICFGAYLQCMKMLTYENDFVVGLVSHNRPVHPEGDKLLGCFLNTVPYRHVSLKNATWEDYLSELHSNILKQRTKEALSLMELARYGEIQQKQNPFFDTLFNYTDFHITDLISPNVTDTSIGEMQLEVDSFEETNTFLDFIVGSSNSGMYVNILQRRGFVSNWRLEEIFECYLFVLEKLLYKGTETISVPRKLLQGNLCDSDAVKDLGSIPFKTVPEIFQEKSALFPENTALTIRGGKSLSYGELDELSNKLAHYIRNKTDIEADDRVGIEISRNEWLIVGILGILKSGAAYVPIDPDYPENRKEYIRNDSQCKLIIDRQFIEEFKKNAGSVSAESLEVTVEPSNLAYIIYTSGTTGRPKGVMVEHRNLIGLLFSEGNLFDFVQEDVWTLFHSPCFDFSVWEIFGSLLTGGRLVLFPSTESKDPGAYWKTLAEEKVTILNQTPSAFNNLSAVESAKKEKVLSVRTVIFGGEALKPSTLSTWHRRYPDTKLVNMFGITETTIHVTYKEIGAYDIDNNISNIGTALPSHRTFVLDKNMQPLPLGVAGELYVGGMGVSRGYLGREDLTLERFIDDPFIESGRLYRSGDKVRLLENGEMEYISRVDDQVQLRGFRIELGEVESNLLEITNVAGAVSILQEDSVGDKIICAYIKVTGDVDIESVRRFLSERLPLYMVPSYIMVLEEFPLTPNGKIDKKRLPRPSVEEQAVYCAPSTVEEKTVAQVWSEELGVGQVGMNDDFFALGGDSIKSIRVISKINKSLNIDLTIADLYQHPQAKALASFCVEKEKDIAILLTKEKATVHIEEQKSVFLSTLPTEEKALIEDVYPMSDIERGMVYYSIVADNDGTYHDQFLYQINGDNFDFALFTKAVSLMTEKHESLRVAYKVDADKGMFRLVYREGIVNVTYDDISNYNKKEQEECLRAYLKAERKLPFKVDEPSLWRFKIYNLGDADYCIVFQFHHAILDGWSVASLMTELYQIYENLIENPAYKPAQLNLGYKEYVLQELVAKEDKSVHDFWIDYLSGYKRLDIFNDVIEHDFLTLPIPDSLFIGLQGLSNRMNIPLRNICFGAYLYCMNLLTYENDFVVGLVSHNRPVHPEGDKLLGCFLDSLPYRHTSKKETGWGEYLTDLHNNLLKLKANEALSLREIAQYDEGSQNQNPFFDTLFNYIDFHVMDQLLSDSDGETDSRMKLEINNFEETNTFLDFIVHVSGSSMNVKISKRRGLVNDISLEKLFNYFQAVLEQFINEGQDVSSSNDIIFEDEKELLLKKFIGSKAEYPSNKTVISLFEEQVALTPNNTALIYDGERLTYSEFQERINLLTITLLRKGVSEGDVIGILCDRSFDMMVGIYAILKSGAAYLPISTGSPSERIDYMLHDCGAKLVLTIPEHRGKLLQKVDTVDLMYDPDKNAGFERVDDLSKPDGLAYIIYTSGSTGNPKGVMIKHTSVVNRINWMQRSYPLSEEDTILQKTTIMFDVSVWELFWWSQQGASLCLLTPGGEKDPDIICQAVESSGVTTMHFVPSMLQAFLDHISDFQIYGQLQSLKYVFSSGEALLPAHVNKFNQLLLKNNSSKLINLYGPTEATVDVTYFNCFEKNEYSLIPIGKPIDNTILYILDANQMLMPIGVPGELCIGGIGLALGYKNNEQLTKEKFINNPFVSGEKIYRTGDLARWKYDGNIEFLGRLDNQVKIRGFRIELGEIEAALLSIPEVKESVVTVFETEKEKTLVGYYTSEKTIEIAEIRSHLTESLPDYMIPTFFVYLEKMPLTSNGKLNRKALPDPIITSGAAYVKPSNEIEVRIADAWSEILGVDKVGLTDNFFALGGDSIRSIQISARLKGSGINLSVSDIMTSSDLKELSQKAETGAAVYDQSAIVGEVPLLPVQRWFFDDPVEQKNHFNQSVMLNFPMGITKEELFPLLAKLQEHHDVLRSVFRVGNNVQQEVQGTDFPVSICVRDFAKQENAENALLEACNEIQASINLEEGPLMKIGLFHLHDGSRVLIVIHHLVIDGVSWRILLEDIESLYTQLKKGEEISLPSKGSSYKQWAEALEGYIKSYAYQSAIPFWDSMRNVKNCQIPRDYPGGENLYGYRKSITVEFDEDISTRFLTKANLSFNTKPNDILLTALALAVSQKFGIDSFMVDIEGHGREDVGMATDLSRTLGWFTSIYPALVRKEGDALKDALITIKESLRKIPNNGIDYLVETYLDPRFAANKKPRIISGILFNYLGQFGTDIKDRVFTIASDSVGDTSAKGNKVRYDWEINAYITENKLEVSLSYSEKQYKQSTLSTLMDLYKKNLKKIIEYCDSYIGNELTPSDFTYPNLSLPQLKSLQEKYEIQDIYTLSPLQEGLLFHSLQKPDSDQYFQQVSYRLHGILDIEAVKSSLIKLTERHAVLRSVFVHDQHERALQLVLKSSGNVFRYRDVRSELKHSSREKVVQFYLDEDRKDKFKLNEGKLIRVLLLQTDQNEYEFVWSHHHILMDGWCMGILINEYNALYIQVAESVNIDLPNVQPYSKFISWLEKRDKIRSLGFWGRYLEGYDSLATLPQKQLAELKEYKQSTILQELPQKTVKTLEGLAKKNKVTVNTVLQSAWGILLSRYNNTNDVVFGSVVSGRPSEITGIESMVGLFINTVPVRFRFNKTDQIRNCLIQVQEKAVECEKNHYNLLSDIQQKSELQSRLFNHIFVFENYPVAEKLEGVSNGADTHMEVSNVQIFEQTNYDLVVTVLPGEEITIKYDFNENLYDPFIIEKIKNHYLKIIAQIIADDQQLVSAIELVSDKEKEQLLHEFNATEADYPSEKTVISLFEEQAVLTPDNTALIYEGARLTYSEFQERINYLTLSLIQKGVAKGDIVGIMCDRSFEMMVGIYAILKAGGAYLPLSPNSPIERLAFMLKDCNSELVLTTSEYKDKLPAEIGVVDVFNDHKEGDCPLNIADMSSPEGLAYVIYTSGSTGKPKGVMIKHASVINRINWMQRAYPIDTNDVILQKTTIMFDVSVWELFWWAQQGAALCLLAPGGEKDPDTICQTIENACVTTMHFVPSMLQLFLDYIEGIDLSKKLNSLRLVFSSGEALLPLQVNKFNRFLLEANNTKLINLYGPTEATVDVTYFNCFEKKEYSIVPIGKPIDNTVLYILDSAKKLLPAGVPGELYIGGIGVGLGYINNEELTREKFIDDPYRPDEKIYRTGDLARWLPDGNIEFLGRLDHQVKIRGFRIELGEIDTELKSFPEVKDSAVLVRGNDAEKVIVAYYVSENEIDLAILRKFLRDKLPGYMVPSHFVHLDSMPLTPNGKLDRKKLPEPQIGLEHNSIKPTNEIEKKLVELWSEVLSLEQGLISTTANFFDLGGHSLNSNILNNKINKHFELNVPLNVFFEHSTVKSFALFIQPLITSKENIEEAQDTNEFVF